MKGLAQRVAQLSAIGAIYMLGAGARTVHAQDTTGIKGDSAAAEQNDTSSSSVQNPPGYRGMERPVNVFPADSTGTDSSASANATSRINQRERQDSLAKPGQNPPGYRGMERPAGAGEKKAGGEHAGHQARTAKDSAKWGYSVDSSGKAENPPGYRGMERPVNVFPVDSSANADSTAPGNATSRVNQRRRQDSSSTGDQNPPGYRGMERPAGDSASQK